ncbi:hypothetical protein Ciccas_001473 [Cichlidogyrus casuarinus]|uniref:DEK-C domain-containing protein n=1 Tax=Cichlidogyrus casuarinus TaxID=1844966 RepID=A0ABD2QK09_9PLAT
MKKGDIEDVQVENADAKLNDEKTHANGSGDNEEEPHDFNGEHTKTNYKPKNNDKAKSNKRPSAPLPEPVVRSKRERKTVTRFCDQMDQELKDADDKAKEQAKKALDLVKKGSGVALDSIPYLQKALTFKKQSELHDLCHVICGYKVVKADLKAIVREFNGFNFGINDPEYEKRKNFLAKRSKNVLRDMAKFLHLKVVSSNSSLIEKILGFLMKPDPKLMNGSKDSNGTRAKKVSSNKANSSSEEVSSHSDEAETESDKSNASDSEDHQNGNVNDEENGKDAEENGEKEEEEEEVEDEVPSEEVLTAAINEYLKTADLAVTSLKSVRTAVSI